MKGQYLVVNEVLIFAFGVAIAVFILLNFQTLKLVFKNISIEDQLFDVSNLIKTGVVKAVETGANTTVRLHVPQKLSNEVYKIYVTNDVLVVSLLRDSKVNVTQEFFNLSSQYNIIGSVVSSAEYVDITFNGTAVEIKRA
jgi:hypothetical protein